MMKFFVFVALSIVISGIITGCSSLSTHPSESSHISSTQCGPYEKAIDECTKAIRLNPKDIGAYSKRAYNFNALGKYQDAIDDYNQAISLGCTTSIIYNSRGSAYFSLGQYQKL